MAASSRRMNGLWSQTSLALLFSALLLHYGICQESNPTISPVGTDVQTKTAHDTDVTEAADSTTSRTATGGDAAITTATVTLGTQQTSTRVSSVSVQSAVLAETTEEAPKIIPKAPHLAATVSSKSIIYESIDSKLGLTNAEHKPKNNMTVLVSILVSGLLLAAVLIGGYCWKNNRVQNAKVMRLADESCHIDEENQGNTLVSVAPLNPPEPEEKPSINGESPDGVKTQVPTATNGHSTAKNPVADTEL
ncbi:hematopoietic progenitor cell antigen CD34 [Denticeps clupeoides]|uniref:Uncharacterized protein n=1 Tax=Denticeps clupeoides TaxID=299321 RepID=A0AAY4DSU2_9TELE|nr:hematopoietic progenitor cell antigen CD34-like [Denticeps clupeoides]